jgi:hypothetical protein
MVPGAESRFPAKLFKPQSFAVPVLAHTNNHTIAMF